MAALKRLSGRSRLLVAALAVVAAAGVAAGFVLTSGEASTSAGPAGVLARGQFRSISWGTHGTATLVRDASGHLMLRFDNSFTTRAAPDLYVYLDERTPQSRTGGNRGQNLLVGPLASAFGRQQYDLPAKAEQMVAYTVEIYCAECDRTQGVATLQPTPLGSS